MKLLRFMDRHLEGIVMTLLLGSMVLVMLAQIVCRYLLCEPLLWSEEFCQYCYIWLMFLAFSYSIRLGSDLRVRALVELLPPRAKWWMDLVCHLGCLAFTAFLFAASLTTVRAAAQIGERGVALDIPITWVYAASTAGYGLGALRCSQNLLAFLGLLNRGEDWREAP